MKFSVRSAMGLITVLFVMSICLKAQTNSIENQPCPKFCPEGYQPVCGTDHVTYNNWCLLAAVSCRTPDGVQIDVIHAGDCFVRKCPWTCDQFDSPVCGSDGITYRNVCELEKTSCGSSPARIVVLKHEGNCTRDWCKKSCPRIYRPVCGSNNVTYVNECALRVSNCNVTFENPVTVWYEESCRDMGCDRPCTSTFRPSCGTDGVTYPNSCALEEAICRNKTELLHEGVCNKTDPICPIPCTLRWSPVCGNDGVTYPSLCYLEAENCYRDEDERVKLKHEGLCGNQKSKCPLGCTDIYQPVCGSDKVTYNSACLLEQENCDKRQQQVEIVKAGICD